MNCAHCEVMAAHNWARRIRIVAFITSSSENPFLVWARDHPVAIE
jgi:hypothetical protein